MPAAPPRPALRRSRARPELSDRRDSHRLRHGELSPALDVRAPEPRHLENFPSERWFHRYQHHHAALTTRRERQLNFPRLVSNGTAGRRHRRRRPAVSLVPVAGFRLQQQLGQSPRTRRSGSAPCRTPTTFRIPPQSWIFSTARRRHAQRHKRSVHQHGTHGHRHRESRLALEVSSTSPSNVSNPSPNPTISNNANTSFMTGSVSLDFNPFVASKTSPESRIEVEDDGDASATMTFLMKRPGSASNPLDESFEIEDDGTIFFQKNVTFNSSVNIEGNLQKGSGTFRIDDPLDPANKYLFHSSVASSEMKNMYDGTITTDASGEAVVELPEWFESFNRDFRYQLTVIGQFAQAIVRRQDRRSPLHHSHRQTERGSFLAGHRCPPGRLGQRSSHAGGRSEAGRRSRHLPASGTFRCGRG